MPALARRDLPRTQAALASEGIALPVVTTGLLSNRDPAARPTIYTAAKLGIPFFKLGYYRYRYADFERHLVKDDEAPRGARRMVGRLALAAAVRVTSLLPGGRARTPPTEAVPQERAVKPIKNRHAGWAGAGIGSGVRQAVLLPVHAIDGLSAPFMAGLHAIVTLPGIAILLRARLAVAICNGPPAHALRPIRRA